MYPPIDLNQAGLGLGESQNYSHSWCITSSRYIVVRIFFDIIHWAVERMKTETEYWCSEPKIAAPTLLFSAVPSCSHPRPLFFLVSYFVKKSCPGKDCGGIYMFNIFCLVRFIYLEPFYSSCNMFVALQ